MIAFFISAVFLLFQAQFFYETEKIFVLKIHVVVIQIKIYNYKQTKKEYFYIIKIIFDK